MCTRKFHDSKISCWENLKNNKDRDRFYSRLDESQKALFHSIQENLFTYCESCAGTGKTTVSMASLIDMLANGDISRIVYIRTPDDRQQSLGYLPGTIEEKTDVYWKPMIGALETLGFQEEMIEELINEKLLETTLDVSLRGVTLSKVGIVLDEVENCTLDTLRLIFTRVADDSHIVVIGDGKQVDQKYPTDDYKKYCEYLAASKLGNKCVLSKNYRGKFSLMAEDQK